MNRRCKLRPSRAIHRVPQVVRALIAVFVMTGIAIANETDVDSSVPLHQRIDGLIGRRKANSEAVAVGLATDSEFIRRTYLDLYGTIPSVEVTRQFLADSRSAVEKRGELIDRLLSSPQHARRLAFHFDEMLMERRPDKHVTSDEWHQYLRQSFLKNKPLDRLFLEILSADGTVGELRPAAKFFLDRNLDVDVLTRDIGRVFLGVDLECAQCHNHPNIDDYFQRHYHGLSAFFRRSYLFNDPKTKKSFIGEKAEGDVTFTSVFTNEKAKTSPRILDLPEIVDPKGTEKAYIVKPAGKARGIPVYSRRQQLAWQMLNAANVDFRRNLANRVWALMMGRGIVEPLDMRHAANPPSHPKVLDLLANELLATKYDLRKMLRELVLTETYQRSSRLESENSPPADKEFAVGLLKPLSPEQLACSVMEATGLTRIRRGEVKAALLKSDPKFGLGRIQHPLWQEESLHAAVKVEATQFVQAFAFQGARPAGFESSAKQALFLMNGPLITKWLTPSGDNLIGRIQQLKDTKQVAEELYLGVFTRLPSDTEVAEIQNYLNESPDRTSALQEIAWAMLTSAEFRFNH